MLVPQISMAIKAYISVTFTKSFIDINFPLLLSAPCGRDLGGPYVREGILSSLKTLISRHMLVTGAGLSLNIFRWDASTAGHPILLRPLGKASSANP